MKMRRIFLVVWALLTFHSMKAVAESLPKQPIFLPFAVAQKGTVLTFDFEAVENNLYTFILTFQLNDDAVTRAGVAKFMGDGGYDPKTHKRLNNGQPIPLRLTISNLNSSSDIPIFDKVIIEEELEAFRGDAKGFSKIIDRIKLSSAKYRVHVEALRDIPELTATPIEFGIYIHRL